MSDSTEIEKNKFGTFRGVFIPSILTIFGVILFLRLGWVVGNTGPLGTVIIVTLSCAITFITALSIAATATNMKVGAGGAYFLVTRSFGIEAGAAIGIPLFFAQALGISFYVAGFVESLNAVFPSLPILELKIVSVVALSLVAIRSTEFALKTQGLILVLIILALLSFFVGVVQYDPINMLRSDPNPPDVSFWVVFAVFFPAVTGIEAGIAMSGDLKDPGRSLSVGTILSVIVGYVVYLIVPLLLWYHVPESVLKSDYNVVERVSWFGPVVVLGIWGATLSSALGALLGGPRTLQALANDGVIWKRLGKGSGPNRDPKLATVITAIIAGVGVIGGDLNFIAPILSMFFLTSYGVLNLASAFEGMIGNPSWRPKIRFPWVVSFFGAFLCFSAMFMIDAGATIVAIAIALIVYRVMQSRQLGRRWVDMRQAMLQFLARYSIYRLSAYETHVKTWRPNILVMSGSPTQRWYLIEFAHALAHGKGFLTVAAITTSKSDLSVERLSGFEKSIREFLIKRGVAALVEVAVADSIEVGMERFLSTYRLGPIYPNTVILGETEREENFEMFSRLILSAHSYKRNLVVMRNTQGLEQFGNDGNNAIHVWWGGQKQNAGLMLTLAYMLQTSPQWRGSELHLKSLVRKEEEKKEIDSLLGRLLDGGRIAAQKEVLLLGEGRSPFDIITETSKDASLVFIGLRPPEENESPEEYTEYYRNLLLKSAELPRLAIVLASEEIQFDNIFL